MAYVLLVEQLERQYLADRTGLATAAQMSGEDVTPPAWEDQLRELDEALAAEPAPVTELDRTNHLWRQAMGAA